MAALREWEKDLRKAVKTQHRFGWSVRNKRGKVLVQRYWQDTGIYERKVIPIPWESGRQLDVLSALRKINDAINGGLNLKEACELILPVDGEATRIEWSEVVKRFKSWLTKSGYIGQSTWEGNYKNTLDRVLEDLAGEKQPASVSGKGILERLQYDKFGKLSAPGSRGRRRRIINAAKFLTFAVETLGMDARWLPPKDLKDLKGIARGDAKSESANAGQAVRITETGWLKLMDSLQDPRWRLVIGLLGTFGLRAWELKYASVDGDTLFISKGKRTSKGTTDPRHIEYLDPIERPGLGKQLLLELSKGVGLPPLGPTDAVTSSAIDTFLRRRAVWNELRAEANAAGEKLKVYSFRHRYAFATAMIYEINPKSAADLMGHSFKTHCESYQKWVDKDKNSKVVQTARTKVLQPVNNP